MSKLVTMKDSESSGDRPEFHEEIRKAVNRCSVDTELKIADFILADYVLRCLQNLKEANILARGWEEDHPVIANYNRED